MYLTYLALIFNIRDGIGTFSSQRRDGCQGFFGPLPSAFLDKCPEHYREIKNWRKDKGELAKNANIRSDNPTDIFLKTP